jgi:hypothetical protein
MTGKNQSKIYKIMDIEVFTICDFAQVNQSKMTIVGTFNSLSSDKFPVIASFYIAVRVRFEKGSEGKYRLSFTINNRDKETESSKLTVPADISHIDGDLYIYQLAISINNMKFDEPGEYTVDLYIDDFYKSIPLYIMAIDLTTQSPL